MSFYPMPFTHAVNMMRQDSLIWERINFTSEEEARKLIEKYKPFAWELYKLIDSGCNQETEKQAEGG